MARLNGKVAVITGASKGIGAAIAEKLGSEGANVVVNYVHDKAGAEKVTEKIKQSGGNAISVQADVSKAEDIKKLFAETTRTFGNVDILVNNAGEYEFRSLESLDEEHFRKIFDLNVLGLLLTPKEAVAHMNGQGGSIINVSSIAAKTAVDNSSVYSATKGAVDLISRALPLELADWNGGLVIVEGIAGASRGERAAGRGNVSRWGRQTSASACRNTSSGR